MGDAVIDRQFQHLGVDQDHPHVFRIGLEHQRQQHRVQAHGFTGTGGTGHQQVRHLAEIRHHRVAGNVLAQRQGQRRSGVVEHARADHLGEADHLALLVGNLDAHRGLAGDHFHHPHTDHRQGAGQVLGQVADLGHLDARRRLNLEAGDHRAGLHRHHFGVDVEVLELDLQQPGHGVQRFLGVTALAVVVHRVEQLQRRQVAAHLGGEQGALLLFLDALALFHRLGGLGDLGRGAVFLFLLRFGDHLGALVARLAGGLTLGALLAALGEPGRHFLADAQHQRAQTFGEDDPGQVGEHGDADQEQRHHHQGAAQGVERRQRRLPDHLAEDAAGVLGQRQAGAGEMHVGQRGAAHHGQHEAHQPQAEQRPAAGQPGVALAQHLEGPERHQHREYVGHVAEQTEQQIGAEGARASAGVAHLAGVAHVGPARITAVVGDQSQQQIQRQGDQGDHHAFHQAFLEMAGKPGRFRAGGCLGHSRPLTLVKPIS